MLKQICYNCNTHLGSIEEPGIDDERISHGVCLDCFPKFVAGSGESFESFIESLPAPVFLVDQNGCMLYANSLGQKLTSKKNQGEMQGRLGGEVFSCKHAKLPGGCGQTIHCRTCTIRETVSKTFETGNAYTRVPAYMDLGDLTGDKTIRFLISTEKVENVVLLRIDDSRPVESADSE